MIRLEIITNRTLEDELTAQLNAIGCKRYSIIPEIHGTGRQEPRQGDAIWPEINFIMIIYCEQDMLELITKGLRKLKERYPNEGLRAFTVEANLLEIL